MFLEQIARSYGMSADYYDMTTGYIYKLPDAIEENGKLKVPVMLGDVLIGYAEMEKPL